MGIQATVKILDLLHAGCTLVPVCEHHNEPDEYFYSLVVTFPSRDEYVFNGGGPGEATVSTDVNHWGENRDYILPPAQAARHTVCGGLT